MPHRPPTKYKVRRGQRRTRKETAAFLGLPSGKGLPGHVCKLPDHTLDHIKWTTAQRMLNKAEANGEMRAAVAHPARPTDFEPMPEPAPTPFEESVS